MKPVACDSGKLDSPGIAPSVPQQAEETMTVTTQSAAPGAKARVPAIEGWFRVDGDTPHLIGTRCKSCQTYFFPKETFFCRNPDCVGDEFEEVELRPRRVDVDVELVAIGWVPHWLQPDGREEPAI